MSDEIKNLVLDMEKKHKKFLSGYSWGEVLKMYSLMGFIPVVFIVVVVLLCLVFRMNWLVAIVLYAVLLLCIHITGRIKFNVNKKRLQKLNEECRVLNSQYLEQKCRECGIKNYKSLFKPIYENPLDENEKAKYYDGTVIRYESGVEITNGNFYAPVKHKGERIDVYCLNNAEMKEKYNDVLFKLDSDKVSINKSVSAVQFNQKFGVMVPKSQEKMGVKFFSPNIQLNMYRSPMFDGVKKIEINNGRLSAVMLKKFQLPTRVDAFEIKSFVDCFNEIDRYCKERKEQADYINQEIQFML